MSRHDAMQLDESLDAGDVSRAWLVWSGAAEVALADAFRFGGPVPTRFLVLGRGSALFQVVRLGGPLVKKARCNAADADAADVFLYRDSSIAPLLVLRRRFKAVMDVLGAMVQYGVSLARSVELTAQWRTGFLLPDLCILLLLMILMRFRVWVLVIFIGCFLMFIIVSIISFMRLWFIAGMRLRNWIREDPVVHPKKWLPTALVHPAPFLQCKPLLSLGGSGVLADPARIDEQFRKAWLPYFCRSGQRDTSLEEFNREVDGWLPLLPEVNLLRLTGQVLADAVRRKGATAGSLDGWGWRELKVLPVPWFDELARILTKVEDVGVWLDGLLDAYIVMIPKTDGDATPLGQRPLGVLPVVYRIWASARMGQLEDWFKSWVPDSVFSAGGGRGSVEAWYTSALDIEEVLTDSDVHLFVAYVVKSFDTVDRRILDKVLSCLGLPGWFRNAYFEYQAHGRLLFMLASGLEEPWTRDGENSLRSVL